MAAVPPCILLTSSVAAQETPEADDNDRIAILFRIVMQALTEAEQAVSDDTRDDLHFVDTTTMLGEGLHTLPAVRWPYARRGITATVVLE